MWVIYCNVVYGAATRQGGEHLIRLARAGRPAYKNTKRRIFTQENCYRYNQRCIVIRYFGLTILDWMWMCASLPSWIRGQSREVAILWRRGARTPQIPLCTRAKKEKKNNFWRRRSRSSNREWSAPTEAGSGLVEPHAAAAASPRRRRRLQKRTSRAENSTNRLLLLLILFSTAPAQINSTFQNAAAAADQTLIWWDFLLRLIKSSLSLRPRGDPGFDCFVSSSPSRAGVGIDPRPARSLARSLCAPKEDSSWSVTFFCFGCRFGVLSWFATFMGGGVLLFLGVGGMGRYGSSCVPYFAFHSIGFHGVGISILKLW